jgi:hypothetical protein
MKRYKVTCLDCGESDILNIDDQNHFVGDSEKKLLTNLLSYRWRPDLRWGYLCKCGNDNRLAPQEADDFDKLVDGDPITVQKIAASLLIPDEKQFEMRSA